MRPLEWIATQPLKATGTYGFYQLGKEVFDEFGSPDTDVPLPLAAFLGLGLPLASRGSFKGILDGSELAAVGSFTVFPAVDVLGWYGTFQLTPQIEHMFPQTDHMLGGLAPFLIARAGVNLASHLVADIAGLASRQRRKTRYS